MNIYQIHKYVKVVLFVVLTISCSKEHIVKPTSELDGLKMVNSFENGTHTIALYTSTGNFQTGYNKIFLQIKNTDGSLIDDATVSWTPVMQMQDMEHSCPASSITKSANAIHTYTGFIVFQMAGSASEHWELKINYTIDGKTYAAKTPVKVVAAPKRVVESFEGSDHNNYVLALVEPSAPQVAINDMKAVLYKMESMMNFKQVDHFKIKIDPRMPGMGNHSSPNNIDLTEGKDNMYEGKLSLTMTGYWKINLQLEDAAKNIVKGEPITDDHESSSIFFELEF